MSLQIAMYVFFPVGVFYYFNLPDFYDRVVVKKKVRCTRKYSSEGFFSEQNFKLKFPLDRTHLKTTFIG